MRNDNNLLLLTFLGAKIENNRISLKEIVPLFLQANSYTCCLEEDEECNILDTINFDTSWDWLMLVVDKIESLEEGEFSMEIDGLNCKIYGYTEYPNLNIFASLDSKIESVYNACVKFIKWYNENGN